MQCPLIGWRCTWQCYLVTWHTKWVWDEACSYHSVTVQLLFNGFLYLQGESFDFATAVVVDGAVEVWMSAVEKEMRTTLHRYGMTVKTCQTLLAHSIITYMRQACE